jgi:hypothetical protein
MELVKYTYADLNENKTDLKADLVRNFDEVIVGSVLLVNADAIIVSYIQDSPSSLHRVKFDVVYAGEIIATFHVMRYQSLLIQRDDRVLIFTIVDGVI